MNNVRMILMPAIILLIVIIAIVVIFNSSQMQTILSPAMDAYPDAVEITDDYVRSEEFLVDEMYISPVSFEYLLTLGDIKAYGTNDSGYMVFNWYSDLNLQNNWMMSYNWSKIK